MNAPRPPTDASDLTDATARLDALDKAVWLIIERILTNAKPIEGDNGRLGKYAEETIALARRVLSHARTLKDRNEGMVADEREACAKIADRNGSNESSYYGMGADDAATRIAEEIRARSALASNAKPDTSTERTPSMIYVCPNKEAQVFMPCVPCDCGMDKLKAFGGDQDPIQRGGPRKPDTAPAESGDWVMVPREPTAAMVNAGNDAYWNQRPNALHVYRAMLASAPQPKDSDHG